MSILDLALKTKKLMVFNRVVSMGNRIPPKNVDPPTRPEDAMTLGYRLGLKDGYSEGLTDGVGIGLDVCVTTDTMEVC